MRRIDLMKGALSAVIVRIPARRAAANEPMRRGRSVRRRDLKQRAGVVLVLSSALAACPLPLLAQQASPKPITLATLIDVMEAREKLTDSVTVRWTQNERYNAGALLAKPSTWTSPCEMLLKGGSMRYVGKMFSHVGGSVNVIDHVSSYDGIESRHLQGSKPPRGFINEEKVNRDVELPSLQPLMLYFRPLAEPYAILKRKTLRLLDERKSIDGHECVTVDDGHLRVYFDCDRDFVPVAFDRYTKDRRLVYDGSLEYYRKQGAIRWLPKAFQVTLHAKGQNVPDRIRGDGVQTEIGAPFKDSDFLLKFEPGTVFWDMRTRQQYRVRDDGTKEPIQRPGRRRAPPK
jgi:hypothetical protein